MPRPDRATDLLILQRVHKAATKELAGRTRGHHRSA
jgi:hypothetical protein